MKTYEQGRRAARAAILRGGVRNAAPPTDASEWSRGYREYVEAIRALLGVAL